MPDQWAESITMLTENLAILYERDIRKLKTEINAYPNESSLWKSLPGITNSGGNLCLHLLGNLQHYIGAGLGRSGYTRNRPEEFSQKNIPLASINQALDHTIERIPEIIRSLSPEMLSSEYPEKVFDHAMSTEYFLLHLLGHLNYHLGQINYHRRIVSGT